MKASRKRLWARVEAVAIALVFMAASLALALHAEHKGSTPSYGDFPSPPAAEQPASPPRSAAPTTSSGRLIRASFEQPSAPAPSSPGTHTRAPKPHQQPPAGRAPQGVWTWCQPSGGGLTCKGPAGIFTCTTSASTGDTSCKGNNFSFGCSTDPNTGARQCDGSTDSWRCVTNADTGRTGCAGTNGSYSCAPTANAAEGCTGVRYFTCYDFADGRECGTSKTSAPDCFFEPIFGAFCRT